MLERRVRKAGVRKAGVRKAGVRKAGVRKAGVRKAGVRKLSVLRAQRRVGVGEKVADVHQSDQAHRVSGEDKQA
jgi:hypothetical protein